MYDARIRSTSYFIVLQYHVLYAVRIILYGDIKLLCATFFEINNSINNMKKQRDKK